MKARTVVLALLVLVALAIRLVALGAKPLWQDEGSSVFYARLPLEILFGSLCDPHPPGYYLTLRAVLAFGSSEWWVRLPSALGGALAVLLTYVQARVMLRPLTATTTQRVTRAALLAAGLVAVAPLHVWYSQEARPYALLSALALAMTAAGMWWWRRPGLARAAAYVLAGWLAFSVEYGALAAWLLLSLLLVSGWPWREAEQRTDRACPRLVCWLALQGLVMAPFAWWWLQSAQGIALARPSYHAVFLAVQAWNAGLLLTPQQAQWIVASALAAGLLAGVAFAFIVRRSPSARGWLGSQRFAALAAVVLLLLALWGVAPRLYSVKRHLVVFVPYVAIAFAWALTDPAWRRPRRVRSAALALLAICLILSLAAIVLVPKSSWREAVDTLAARVQTGDLVGVDEMNAPVFNYYWQDRLPWQPLAADNLEALAASPAATRVWLAGDVTPYRDVFAMLPAAFNATRVVSQRYAWQNLEIRAYDAGQPSHPPAAPTYAQRLGLLLVSPLDIDCRQSMAAGLQ